MAGQSGGGGGREKAKVAKLTKAIMDKNRAIFAKKKNSDARSKAAAKKDAVSRNRDSYRDIVAYGKSPSESRVENLFYAAEGKEFADKFYNRSPISFKSDNGKTVVLGGNYKTKIDKKTKVQRKAD